MSILTECRKYASAQFGLCSYYFIANLKMGFKHVFNLTASIIFLERETINQSWHCAL